jgi:hypothetical protein
MRLGFIAGLLCSGTLLAEAPGLSFSLPSLYGSVSDYKHIRDVGAAWEIPVRESASAILRIRYLRLEQDEWPEDERGDNIYANVFPSTYRVLGFQTALRRYPWEWMPGFYSEALLGYKRITGKSHRYPSLAWFENGVPESEIRSFANDAFEAALGFGYQWRLKRMRTTLGFAFGPELIYRSSRLAGGGREAAREFTDMLRFNQLEMGLAF